VRELGTPLRSWVNVRPVLQLSSLPLLIAALSAVILFANLHRGDLSGYDDAAFAHEGKQVVLSGDWFEVRLNGYLNFDKPPLFVWCEAASMKTFGISDFAAKFPAALFGLGTILLVYFIAREMTDRFWLPIIAMFVMATTQYFMKYSTHAMSDVPFTFFFALAMLSYLKGRKQQKYLLLCGVATGLANLTRSPMGWFPLVIIVLHLMVIRQSYLLQSKYLIACFLVAMLLPMIWYWSEYQRYGGKFLSEHFANLINHAVSQQKRGAAQLALGFLEYPYLLLKLYWPWLPFMLIGFVMQFRKMLREREAAASLLVIWVLCLLLPFSLADSKVLRYVLAAFPAFSILSAIVLDKYVPSNLKLISIAATYWLICVGVLTMLALPSYRLRAQDMRILAPVAEAATLPDQRIVLYNFGERRWDYLNQMIWYGNRLCEQTEDLNKVRSKLELDRKTVVIMDKSAVARLAQQGFDIEVLGESKDFVCFRRTTRAQRYGAIRLRRE
jgi:4-amino-4-deoxy-L-arabinose transferase-like glycosyltransferase